MAKPLPMFVEPSLCAPCGGKCCKGMPGATHPEDFGGPDRATMLDRLVAAFASGQWAIDWWDGDPRVGVSSDDDASEEVDRLTCALFVRPATVSAPGRLRDPAWTGSACVLLTPTGCSLADDARPRTCRELKPGVDGCDFPTGWRNKRDPAIAWLPYHDVIISAERAVKATGAAHG